jgi:hypothetical protein
VTSIARIDFHKLFDQGNWLLLPEDRIIDEFDKNLSSVGGLGGELFVDRKNFPQIDVCLYIMT